MSEGMRGDAYLRVGGSRMLALRARLVTESRFHEQHKRIYSLGKSEGGYGWGYKVILHDCGDRPEIGVFVFEGADLDKVRAALAKRWELDEVRLVDEPLQLLLKVPITEGLTDEDLFLAVTYALGRKFPGHKLEIIETEQDQDNT